MGQAWKAFGQHSQWCQKSILHFSALVFIVILKCNTILSDIECSTLEQDTLHLLFHFILMQTYLWIHLSCLAKSLLCLLSIIEHSEYEFPCFDLKIVLFPTVFVSSVCHATVIDFVQLSEHLIVLHVHRHPVAVASCN